MTNRGISLQNYAEFLRRTRFFTSSVFLGAMLLFVVVIRMMPEQYRSVALIGIEKPEIREDIVSTTVAAYDTNLRIDGISYRVLGDSNVASLINDFSLYREIPQEERSSQFRRNVDVQKVLNSDDPRVQFRGPETTGFEVAFYHPSPETAFLVTQKLAQLFLKENTAKRAETVFQTSSFLGQQADKLKVDLARTEEALAEFKERNVGSLPQDATLNVQLLDRAERDMDNVERELVTLQARKDIVLVDLAQTSPSATLYSESGEPILGTDERLEILRREQVTMAARYSPDHPDLIKLRKEIKSLSSDTQTASVSSIQDELDAVQSELDNLRQQYSGDHPDVQRLEHTLDGLQQQLSAASSQNVDKKTSVREPNNPAYLHLQVQLANADSEIAALRNDREELRLRISSIETNNSRIPGVEKELTTLTRDYEIARQGYNDIREKQLEAERAIMVEDQQKAEHYVLQIDARLPESAAQPTHRTLVVAGLFLSITISLGAGLTKEALDDSVRGAHDIREIFDAPPIAVIPIIENHRDALSHRSKRGALAISFVGIMGLVILTAA